MGKDGVTVTDTFQTADGKTVTVAYGNAYANGWHYSGFSGQGYVVHVDGVQVAQVAWRVHALAAAADAGAVGAEGSEFGS
jgi:hypothetical protein